MDKAIKNKAYTIRGIAILAIILCHAPISISKYCYADLAVSIFFFFTGYFIMNKYLTNKAYFDKSYLIKKIYNIYIPFVISNLIYILNYIIIYNKSNFKNLLDLCLKIFGIIPANGYLWFVPHVLLYYIICYIFYHKTKNYDIRYYLIMFLLYISIVIGIFSIFNIWGGYVLFEHILLAVGGIYSLINYKNSNTGLPNKKSKIIFCLIFIILFIYNLYHSHLIITLILQIMTPFFFLIIIKYNKSLDYLGKNSLLLYLYHIPIIMILNYYIVNKNELVYTIMYLIINFLIIVFWNIIKKSNKNKMIIYSLAKNKTDS